MTDCGAVGARSARGGESVEPSSPATNLFFSTPASAPQIQSNVVEIVEPLQVRDFAQALQAYAPKSKEALRLKLYAGLILLDIFCVICGFTIANGVRFENPFEERGWSYSAAILPLFIALAFATGAYSLEALERPAAGTWKSLRALS
jgi:hypothetical protein